MKHIKEININSWSKFKGLIDKFQLEWIYRGQSDSKWDLKTSLERSKYCDWNDFIEKDLLEEFKGVAKLFLKSEEVPESTLEWIALMQHFCVPTRLIDFTNSPYVAAYFAFEAENKNSTSVSIWCLNKVNFFRASCYKFDKIKGLKPVFSYYLYEDSFFDQIFQKKQIDCAFPLSVNNKNQRYFVQQSVFLTVGNPATPLMEQLSFLDYIENPSITKFNIPNGLRKEILRDLHKMNITRASLFPNLDGFAKSIKMKHDTLKTIGEIGKDIKFLQKKEIIPKISKF